MARTKKILTNKQRILRMVERWEDDISFEQALYHMSVMQAVMEGIKDVEEGRVYDHDDVFDELERLCDEEENQARLGREGQKKSSRAAGSDRGGRLPKNGEIIRKSPQKVRKSSS